MILSFPGMQDIGFFDFVFEFLFLYRFWLMWFGSLPLLGPGGLAIFFFAFVLFVCLFVCLFVFRPPLDGGYGVSN